MLSVIIAQTMKKLFIALGIILILAILGLGIALATFNVDRLRPLLVSHLQQALARPVRLARIRLTWSDGIAIQLQDVAIDEDTNPQREPILQVESLNAVVRLIPLFRREIQVSSIVLGHPRIHVVRDGEGRVNFMGLAAAVAPAGASRQATRVGEHTVLFQIASVRIENGSLHWTDEMTQPMTERWVNSLDVAIRPIVPGHPMELDVTGALERNTPNFHLTGRLALPDTAHAGSLEDVTLTVDQLSVGALLPAMSSGDPQVLGTLTASATGQIATLDPSQMLRAISGDGNLKVNDAQVANFNLLRTVFERCSVIPGLVEKLEARLPPDYRAKLSARDTLLLPIEVSARLEDGRLRFQQASVRTDAFGVLASGEIGLEGAVNLRCTLQIEPVFSEALIKSVKELRALTNSKGEIEIPVLLHGALSQLAVAPDLNYIASKVVMTKAADWLGEALQEETGESSESQESSPFGQLLHRVLQPDASPDPSR